MPEFTDIAFGYSSAETERQKDPGLLIEGFIDFNHINNEALDGDHFLFLGYKGSGKTSLAEHIELSLSDDFSNFVKLVNLSDFPFTPFSKIIRGDAEPETKYPTAWSWILLIYLLESMSRDEGGMHNDQNIFIDTSNAFK